MKMLIWGQYNDFHKPSHEVGALFLLHFPGLQCESEVFLIQKCRLHLFAEHIVTFQSILPL